MALKEKALKRLAEKFAKASLPYAVGGTWLLQQKGLVDNYHEFEIYTDDEHYAEAVLTLSRLGMKSEDAQGEHFHFDGADVLLLGSPCYGSMQARFGPDSVAETITVLGLDVPVLHLEDLFIWYLLGKDSRLSCLEDYFRNGHPFNTDRLSCACTAVLPDSVMDELHKKIGG